MLALSAPSFHFLLVSGTFLGHFENIPVRLLVLAIQGMVLFF
jgi:hypothetical protein